MTFEYILGYFRETTVHGFKYVADGRTALERALWVCTIAASFFVAGIMVASSLRDTSANPISTSVEKIPVQDIPFPAVTVRGVKVNSARRLLENTLNYLKFDCFSEEGIRCAKETARIRSDFRPFIVRVLKAKYKETSAMLSKLVKERTFDDEDDASLFLCRLSLTPRYRPHWGQVIELLFLAEDSEDIASLEEQLLSAVADHFRLHVDSFFARLAEIFGEPLDLEPPHKLRTRPCFKELGLFESNAKIFVASVLSLLGDEKELPLGTMLTVGKSRIGEKALEVDLDGVITQEQTDAHEIVRKLPLLLLSGAGNDSTRMVTADNLFHYLTAWFSGLPESPDSSSISCNVEDNVILMTYPELGGNNSTSLCEESQDEGCCMLQDIIRSNRHASVKLAKYDYQPASRVITQRGEMEDAIRLAIAFDYKTLDQVPETSSPMFIGCKYADSHGTSDCSSYFSPVYNTDGVGYTFNHARFYEIFKQTEFNDMFYKEINRKKEEQGFRYIRGHGRAFSLYFFVKPDNFDSAHMDNYISVHSPFQLADLESAVFKLEPGWTYTMVVDPSVVETDQGALAMDPETRGCLSAVDDGHGLKAFRRYTQASCLFECHLRVASSRCNCTPWDYLVVPGEDSSWPVCNVVETQFCFEVALSEPVNSTYCDCPNNCEELQYPHSVLMERTKKELCTITYDDAFVQKVFGNQRPNMFFVDPTNWRDKGANMCWQALEKEISVVKVVVASPTATKTVRSRRVTFSDQVGSLGGTIGLFSGMSILSLAEMLYWAAKGAVASFAKYCARH